MGDFGTGTGTSADFILVAYLVLLVRGVGRKSLTAEWGAASEVFPDCKQSQRLQLCRKKSEYQRFLILWNIGQGVGNGKNMEEKK
jgi:hypothetical protein